MDEEPKEHSEALVEDPEAEKVEAVPKVDEVVEKLKKPPSNCLSRLRRSKKSRNLLSNCLSRLYLLKPPKRLTRLLRNLKKPSPNRLSRL